MADETTVQELNKRVDHLEDEQQRLAEQQRLKQEEQQKTQAPGGDGSEKKPQQEEQKKDGGQQEQQAQKPPEKPKKPFAQRARRYVKRNPGRVLLGIVALVALVIGSVLLWIYFS